MFSAGTDLMGTHLILQKIFDTLPNPKNIAFAELLEDYAILTRDERKQEARLRDCFNDAEGRN
ncbi:MAG: hypothetical protein KGI54_14015 [Pseudomonadota bacterium]|nr:hypothetical protein [Pseudomonadota bacterium]